MKRTTLSYLGLGLVAFVGLSCSSLLTGGEPACPPENQQCDPNNPNLPVNPSNPETVVGLGPNGGSGGMGGLPFDPTGNGSTGVAKDPKGNIILDPKGGSSGSTSVIWVANSGDGTVSKIDTRSLKQLARYQTFPGGNGDPSRTSVSLGGDVVVANRAWQNGSTFTRASATKIAGDKGGCVDRNANGRIDTYEGEATAVPAQFEWTNPAQPSPDECVLWLTPLNTNAAGQSVDTLPRGAAFDGVITDTALSQYVYVGLFNTSEVVRLDATTGAVQKRISVAPNQPYGLVVDKFGNVWSSGRDGGNSLAKIEVNNADKVTVYSGAKANPCNYGITSDARGYIYGAWEKCVARFNPVTELWERLDIPSAGRLRGLAIDNNNKLWVADDVLGVHYIDATAAAPMAGATTLKYMRLIDTRQAGNATGNVGAAIDFDNHPWTITTSNRAIKIDPTAFTFTEHTLVRGSYTYSDMSGYQLRNASRAGTFRYVFKGCEGAKTTWTNLKYTLSAPRGTSASVRYRGAVDIASLPASTFVPAAGMSPVPIMLPALPMNAPPTYLQVEITMTSVDSTLTPILSALSAGFTCYMPIG